MHQLYQDAMSVIRPLEKSDLFVTMNCNPKWEEITKELKSFREPNDGPDLIAKERLASCTHSSNLDKPKDLSQINGIVSAEIPEQVSFPQTHKTVKACMMHGKCGSFKPNAVCMVDGKCSKNFPKQFAVETIMTSDTYPVYKRSPANENNQVLKVTLSLENPNELNNSEKQNQIKEVNEITRFQSAKLRLSIYLDSQQMCYFDQNNDISEVLSKNEETQLTAFFKLNSNNFKANDLFYYEIPKHFSLDNKSRSWKPPVVRKANCAEIAAASINRSYLWYSVQSLNLTINMRVKNGDDKDSKEAEEFSKFFLRIGEGKEKRFSDQSGLNDLIKLPSKIIKNFGSIDIIKQVYGDLYSDTNEEFLMSRAILCRKNSNVDLINNLATDLFEG
ncbi:unnamed protein product, partial [Brachionus calyciflorus]